MNNNKILMVIASEGFRDEEFFVPAEILENAGFEIKITSDKAGTAEGDDGGQVGVDFEIGQASPEKIKAIIFIGGPGALEHLDNEESYKIAREFHNKNKIIAAICIAPVILAKAGLLQDKKATVWTTALNKSGKKEIEKKGALYKDQGVIQDGRIITANGPKAAKEFAKIIISMLKKLQPN